MFKIKNLKFNTKELARDILLVILTYYSSAPEWKWIILVLSLVGITISKKE